MALSSNDTPILDPRTAAPGRARGLCEVAGEITIKKITQGVSSETNMCTSDVTNTRHSYNFPLPISLQRRTEPNDGRRRENCARNYKMNFTPVLSPSTGIVCSINIDRMEQGYTSIVKSTDNKLPYQLRIQIVIKIKKIRKQIHLFYITNSQVALLSGTISSLHCIF